MSSCFFSSRLNTRISATSVSRNRFSTALPKVPVPPVIRSVLFANILLGLVRTIAFPLGIRRRIGGHLLDHLRPGRRYEPGPLPESRRVQRTVDDYILDRRDFYGCA